VLFEKNIKGIEFFDISGGLQKANIEKFNVWIICNA